MLCVSGRGIYGEEELGSRHTSALHFSGVLQRQSVQHTNPLHTRHSAVCTGTTEERRGGRSGERLMVNTLEFGGFNLGFGQYALKKRAV